MADHAVFREYLQLLRGLEKTVGQLVELERKKAGAVRANDVQLVDDCIRQEQVLSLSLRGAEQKRAKLLKELGLEHVKLFGLEREAPEELRQEAHETACALHRRYEEYQSASDAARTALERVLIQIDQMLAAEQQKAPQPQAGGLRRQPQPGGEEPPEGGHGADFKA